MGSLRESLFGNRAIKCAAASERRRAPRRMSLCPQLLQAAVSLGSNRRSGAEQGGASHCGAIGFSAGLTGTKIESTED
jgi:hypothetical protein